MTGPIIRILCGVRGDIDYTKFFPPLDAGGRARCQNAEDAILLAKQVLEKVMDVAKAKGYGDIIDILNAPREVEDRNTSSPNLVATIRRMSL